MWLVIFVFKILAVSACFGSSNDPREPLMLSPLIKAGRVSEAQQKSRVHNFTSLAQIESHSGFLSVSKTNHLFFWFFPHRDPKAPIILWLQGGPGESALFGLFTEHGPFVIKDNAGNLALREAAWTKTHSILYMDSPVGAGFSFTESQDGFAQNEEDVARDLYEALLQFFKLFPRQKTADFYVAGESYGGKYVPAITRKIHVENQAKRESLEKINLKGMAVGNAFTDPLSTLEYGNYLYNIGLLNDAGRKIFQAEEAKAKKLVEEEKYLEAFKVMDKLLLGSLPESQPSIYEQLTGLRTVYNYLIDEDPAAQRRFIDFVQREDVRSKLHVGNRPFAYFDLGGPVAEALKHDIYNTVKPWVEEILEAPENYRVLLYTGQLDIACAQPLSNNLVESLNWSGLEGYRQAKREIWRSKDKGMMSGYAQTFGNLTQVLVRNAGHRVPFDQSENAFDMINRFTSGASFGSN